MKHRRKRRRRNPGALVTLGWAAGSAAVAGTVSYLVLREFYANKVLEACAGSLRLRNPEGTSDEDRCRIRGLL